MYTLIIVRHAKSSWAVPGQADRERTLNERGKSDAPMMAERLRKRKLPIHAFVSSPATRAYKTCKAFCEVFDYKKSDIIVEEDLYGATPEVFNRVVSQFDKSNKTVAIFSHNPGITEFVNSLGTGIRIDNMPTCAIYAVTMEMDNWQGFASADKEFLFFDYPKLKQ